MHISQILITDDDSEPLSPFLQMAVQTVKTLMPHTEHKVYRKEELRQWIEDQYGITMLKTFDKLVPYAFKADLARYLLLYKLGGWYFDISIRIINGLNVNNDIDMITFADLPQNSGVSYACNNAIIYSKACNKILQYAIESIFSNVQNERYGQNLLSPTGPVCFGKSVAMFSENLNILTGTFADLTPGYSNRNRGFILMDGLLLGLHKPGNVGGDINYLGIKGGNNYLHLYQARKIYDQSINIEGESISL